MNAFDPFIFQLPATSGVLDFALIASALKKGRKY